MNLSPVSDAISSIPGFRYFEDIISRQEERKLLQFVETLDFQPYVMRGQSSRRGIVRFGYDYGAVGGSHHQVKPLTIALIRLRDLCAQVAGLDASEFIASVVTRYPAGATIGWHSDMTIFGPVVYGVSLNNPCVFKIRPKVNPRNILRMTLEPCSLYVMEGQVRFDWEHSIPPVKELRYSITFRTVLG